MLTTSSAHDVVELTAAEERAYIDHECRRLLGMSADEFARLWKIGEFRDNDDPKVTQVAMLLPDAW